MERRAPALPASQRAAARIALVMLTSGLAIAATSSHPAAVKVRQKLFGSPAIPPGPGGGGRGRQGERVVKGTNIGGRTSVAGGGTAPV